eukprot:1293574-Pyramimonas_sp.AAC.1
MILVVVAHRQQGELLRRQAPRIRLQLAEIVDLSAQMLARRRLQIEVGGAGVPGDLVAAWSGEGEAFVLRDCLRHPVVGLRGLQI